MFGSGIIDGYVSPKSHVWFLCYDQETEIVFLPKEQFAKLWKQQSERLDIKIMYTCLEHNQIFSLLPQ